MQSVKASDLRVGDSIVVGTESYRVERITTKPSGLIDFAVRGRLPMVKVSTVPDARIRRVN